MLAGQRFGRYEVRSKLGEGGMGQVYTATDSELGRNVAIKVLPTEFVTDSERRSRFHQEARVISALNHPNIITIYEIGENEHGSFLATEFVEGRTLRDVIKTESLTLSRILKIVEQAANALVAAHAAGIVHRDIKPENIMLRGDGIVKVLDFGLAKPRIPVLPAEAADSNKTVPGTVMGSARYMSPEQAKGLDLDERTDIWSLGVVMYELLAGHVPFEGETTADTMAQVIYKEPLPISHVLPNLPFELYRIIKKALQKDREERYQSVKDLSLDIKSLLFELEHANSGERDSGGLVISRSETSENPTMIHHTISADHTTDHTNLRTVGPERYSVRKVKSKRRRYALLAAIPVLVFVAAGFGIYSYLRSGEISFATAFTRTQISRVNTDGKVSSPALSPDGRYVAFVSGDPGARSLVVRQIATDSAVTVVPATTLNLVNVSFSPEGDHVYYTETRPDGVLNTLYRVPTLGGAPKKLVEDVDSSVTFSPDGKQFAFIRHATSDSSDNIIIADTLTLEMHPFLSTKDTDYDAFSFRLAWSPDGKNFLIGAMKRQGGFVTRTDVSEISIADKTIRRLIPTDIFFASNFVWFEDGSGFLFIGRENQNGSSQIWRSSYPSAELHQITNDFNDYLDLSISADGRKLITIKGDTSSSIWRYSPTSKGMSQLTDESRNLEGFGGLIERSDKSLIYTRTDAKQSQIWAANADGKEPRSLFTEEGYSAAPVVTPDGRFIVFNLQKNKEKTSQLWRADSSGKNAVPLTDEKCDCSDFSPQITADGRTVIFQRQLSTMDRSVLMKVSVDGGEPEVVFSDDELSAFQPRISPDGKQLAFVTYNVRTFDKKIQIAGFENGRLGKMDSTLEVNLVGQFFWSPDGKSLTALTPRGGTPNLWRLPIDGSSPAPITEFKSGRVLNFAWSTDGKSLLIARGNTNNDLVMIRDEAANSSDKAGLKQRAARLSLFAS